MNVGLVQFAAAQSFNVSPKKVPVVQNVLPIAISPSAVDRHRKEVSTFVNFNHLHLKPSSTSKFIIIMEKTEAGLERPLYPRNRCRITNTCYTIL